MDGPSLKEAFRDLSTALLADACIRLHLRVRLAPPGIRPVVPDSRLAGPALPVRHQGSVDVFLEAMESARPGEVMVIDNAGRLDEGCIGDLTVLEAQSCGLAGLVVWGCHRDTAELIQIGVPVFSYGACSTGPVRLDPRAGAAVRAVQVGSCDVGVGDAVFADADGVLFVARERLDDVLTAARAIRDIERRQAAEIRSGRTLREQLHFKDYLKQKSADPSYTLRQHLRRHGGAIEE